MINAEIRNRIRVAAAAYAYEIEADPVITDAEFDALCLKIRPTMRTGNRALDKFFREEFDPNTGSWIHKHPEKDALKTITKIMRVYGNKEEDTNG